MTSEWELAFQTTGSLKRRDVVIHKRLDNVFDNDVEVYKARVLGGAPAPTIP